MFGSQSPNVPNVLFVRKCLSEQKIILDPNSILGQNFSLPPSIGCILNWDVQTHFHLLPDCMLLLYNIHSHNTHRRRRILDCVATIWEGHLMFNWTTHNKFRHIMLATNSVVLIRTFDPHLGAAEGSHMNNWSHLPPLFDGHQTTVGTCYTPHHIYKDCGFWGIIGWVYSVHTQNEKKTLQHFTKGKPAVPATSLKKVIVCNLVKISILSPLLSFTYHLDLVIIYIPYQACSAIISFNSLSSINNLSGS